jgi:hypothetical protein
MEARGTMEVWKIVGGQAPIYMDEQPIRFPRASSKIFCLRALRAGFLSSLPDGGWVARAKDESLFHVSAMLRYDRTKSGKGQNHGDPQAADKR